MVSGSGTGDGGVVVVGAGQGGLQVALSLRDEGYVGPITLVGDEPDLPYQRPPLSKAYLTGKMDRAGLELRPEPFLAERGIALVTGRAATALDRAARRVLVEGGGSLAYGHCVLATGARNRVLPVPGADLAGVVQLRTRADADAIRALMARPGRLAIVGAGFIGLEVAAVAVAAGWDVAVVEATARPMARALSEPMSHHFRDVHERSGVRFAFGAVVSRIVGEGGRATGVETADGRVVPADLVLVGIGVVPNVDLAAEAGLPIENGIVADGSLLTEDPAVSAVGDCVSYPQPFAGGARARLESVGNAIDGARSVAARIAGRAKPFRAVPWFWSDQGGSKLQIAGLAVPHGHTALRGDPASGAFSVFCFDRNRLVAVESVNRAGDHAAARRLLAEGAAITPAEASDPSVDLKGRLGVQVRGAGPATR